MNDLIVVKQLPIIEEQLHALKEHWEHLVLDAEAMVCTEETIQTVKTFRTDIRKEFDSVEVRRKQVKDAILGPYEQFEAVYKDCVTTAFRRADEACSQKISSVEANMKRRCEDGLRDYFAELCALRGLDWLAYERAGIKVDMASAKAKTPKRLMEQLAAFVERVSKDVALIDRQEHAPEIMSVYKATLDAADAIGTVQEYHRQVAKEMAEKEARGAAEERAAEMVRRVEALAPPVVMEAPESIVKCVFIVKTTKTKLRNLKEFLNMEGIPYE